MTPIRITDPDDPRIAAYRDVRERDLVGRHGRFVAEGEVVLRHLLGPRSRFAAESALLAEPRLAALTDVVSGAAVPVYVADREVMDSIVGFPIHRGVLAVGLKGRPGGVETLLAPTAPRGRLLVAVGIGNHDNMGGLFRIAAAFGARGVLLDSTACDPLYRKAIRVSVGAALITPFARLEPGGDLVETLIRLGYCPLALTPGGEEPLEAVEVAGPAALIVGPEGPGLGSEILSRCRRISIRMAPGFDSLNVATAAAIALHHLSREP